MFSKVWHICRLPHPLFSPVKPKLNQIWHTSRQVSKQDQYLAKHITNNYNFTVKKILIYMGSNSMISWGIYTLSCLQNCKFSKLKFAYNRHVSSWAPSLPRLWLYTQFWRVRDPLYCVLQLSVDQPRSARTSCYVLTYSPVQIHLCKGPKALTQKNKFSSRFRGVEAVQDGDCSAIFVDDHVIGALRSWILGNLWRAPAGSIYFLSMMSASPYYKFILLLTC